MSATARTRMENEGCKARFQVGLLKLQQKDAQAWLLCWSFGSSPGSAQSPLCHQAELLASPEMALLSMPAIATFLY